MKTDHANHRNPFRSLLILRFLCPFLAVLLSTFHVACAPNKADSGSSKSGKEAPSATEPADSELQSLTGQVERERELRGQAETRAASESGRREFWETLTVIACMGAVALFLVGTAIGSKGRRHAESA